MKRQFAPPARRAFQPPKPKKGFEAQEARVAAAVPGGARTRGSGCSRRATHKSDIVGELWRVESKTTAAESIRVERAWLGKIMGEALATGKRPALAFGFDEGREDWIAFSINDAQRLMRMAAMLRRGDTAGAQAEAEAL